MSKKICALCESPAFGEATCAFCGEATWLEVQSDNLDEPAKADDEPKPEAAKRRRRRRRSSSEGDR